MSSIYYTNDHERDEELEHNHKDEARLFSFSKLISSIWASGDGERCVYHDSANGIVTKSTNDSTYPTKGLARWRERELPSRDKA